MISLDEPMKASGGGSAGIDVESMISAVLKHAWKIAAFTAFTTAIALWGVLTATPTFVSNGSMFLGDAQIPTDVAPPGALSGLNFINGYASINDIGTYVELLQAQKLVEQSILATGLNSPVAPADNPSMPFWKWKLVHHNSINAFAPKPGDLQALYAGFDQPRNSGATFRVLIEKDGNYEITTKGGWFTSPQTVLTGVIGQPASGGGLRLLLKPAIDGFSPPVGSRFILQVASAQGMANELISTGKLYIASGGTVAQPTKNADITFTWTDPYVATEFVNNLMDSFIATQLSWQTESASATEKFVSDQLNKISTSLDQANQSLANYQAQTGIVDPVTNSQTITTRLSALEGQRLTLQLQQKALQELLPDTEKASRSVSLYLSSQANDVVLQKLVGELADAQVQLQTLRAQYSNTAPNVVVQKAMVDELNSSIRTIIKNDLDQTTQAIASLDSQIADYQKQIAQTPGQTLKISDLKRSSDVLSNLYVLLQDQEQKALVSKATTIINTRIVTPAEVPLVSASPNAKKNVLVGLLIGLFGGIAAALALRTFSGRFQSDEEIKRLSRLPVYGLIPVMQKAEAEKGILSSQPRGQFAEAFRLLRSNLYLSRSIQKSTVIMIISATSADGKTAIATNLAKSLANDGKRVILVDADLYVGRVHEALHITNSPGLTEWLATGTVPKYQTVPNESFMVLTTGKLPQLPAELLNKPAFEQVLAKLREEFDFIILDSPPLPSVSDGMTLGAHADLILSVVNIGNTPRRVFAAHLQAIESLGRRHGMVINSVPSSRLGQAGEYGAEQTSQIPGETMLIAFTKRLKELRD